MADWEAMTDAECEAETQRRQGMTPDELQAANAEDAADVRAQWERERHMTGPELLAPVQAEIDRLAALAFNHATGQEAEDMVAACGMADAVLCSLSTDGVGLNGLEVAVGRLYRAAETDRARRMAVCTMAMLRHTLLPLPGDGWWTFRPTQRWFTAGEVANYRERYPRR